MAIKTTDLSLQRYDNNTLEFTVASDIGEATFVAEISPGTTIVRKTLSGSTDVTLDGSTLSVKVSPGDLDGSLPFASLVRMRYSLITEGASGDILTAQTGVVKVWASPK
jgi:hypothetical protein